MTLLSPRQWHPTFRLELWDRLSTAAGNAQRLRLPGLLIECLILQLLHKLLHQLAVLQGEDSRVSRLRLDRSCAFVLAYPDQQLGPLQC